MLSEAKALRMWRSLTEKVEGRDISPTMKAHHLSKGRSRAGLSHSCNDFEVSGD
jgi:hypothetical protein